MSPVINPAKRHEALAQRVVNLEAWLQTMYQERGREEGGHENGYSGYGGPVAHWWQNRYRYAGPGFDWRYEGILAGYAHLFEKTGSPLWRERLEQGTRDLIQAQTLFNHSGHLPASRFEINPGHLGTPHEAAAALGLVRASMHVADRACTLLSAKRILDALIRALWDGAGFNDRPDVPGRVPNKLATLAEALLRYTEASGEEGYLPYAAAALDDVCRFQVTSGQFKGAVHQYAPANERGDGRFFPFYNARCIAPLVLGAHLLDAPQYLDVAHAILEFLRTTMSEEGTWAQIIYQGGQRATYPAWLAGSADMLYAYLILGEPLPGAALTRLLERQSSNGAFPTAYGFERQISQRPPHKVPNVRDVTPVVGWNDKVFRLLGALLPAEVELPAPDTRDAVIETHLAGQRARFTETRESFAVTFERTGETFYEWRKQEVWARVVHPALEVR